MKHSFQVLLFAFVLICISVLFVGCKFDSTNQNNDGEKKTEPNNTISDISETMYTITYILDDGVNNPNNPQKYSEKELPFDLQNPTKEDMYFDGWYLDSTYTTRIDSVSCVGDIVLYAKFVEGSEGLQYRLINDGEAFSIKGYTGSDDHVLLPSVHLNLPVVQIDEYAFSDCGEFTKITIPASITTIKKSAFSGCKRLAYVNYTGTKSNWFEMDFENVYSNPLFYAKDLYLCDVLLTDWSFPSDVTKIGTAVYLNRTELKNFEVPATVTFIGEYAFYGCTNLKSISIPSSVITESYILYGCSNIEVLKVGTGKLIGKWFSATSFDNSYGIAQQDYLPSNGMGHGYTDVVYYIPNSLRSIEITDGEIVPAAFMNCSKVEYISIPNTVTVLYTNAFSGMDNLKRIDYCGTKEQWEAVEIIGSDSIDVNIRNK